MVLKANHDLYEAELSKKEIEYLVHFTPTINLLSIFEQKKVLSRALLEKNDIEDNLLDFIEFLDEVRYDDKNYINLSISHPNYFLFRRFKERTQNKPYINWCILKIDPKYVCQKETLFSVTNAASRVAKQYGVTGDIGKFKQLFEDRLPNIRNNIRGNLKTKYPTCVQAEVLVKDQIKLKDIIEVCFENDADLANAKAALSNFDTSNFRVNTTLFENSRL